MTVASTGSRPLVEYRQASEEFDQHQHQAETAAGWRGARPRDFKGQGHAMGPDPRSEPYCGYCGYCGSGKQSNSMSPLAWPQSKLVALKSTPSGLAMVLMASTSPWFKNPQYSLAR